MIFKELKRFGRAAVCTALSLIIMSLCFCCTFSVSAASFSGGSGTMEDPYLVTTAEQLQNMKSGLSAHYKLANTIDLSSIANFTPIGNFEKPFTGSFTCDTGSDGRPLYAIKNLKIVLEETPYLGEKINRWEVGLFGSVSGGRIANIYILDAYVENKNEGFARGAVKYNNYKPSQDEMGCAILACNAENTEITQCYTSGKVTGKCNWMAGLVGRAYECQISYCGSSADVINQRGFFGTGGLIGDCSSTVSFCFATGTVEGGGQNATTGGLIGQSCRAFYGVTDCYSTGKVSNKGYEAFSFAGFSGGNGQEHEEVVLENCYTLSEVTDANSSVSEAEGFTVHNSFIASGVKKYYQKDFAVADKSKIASKIGSRSGWEIGEDGYPVISAIKPLTAKEAAAYVAGASVGGASTGNTDNSNSQSTNTGASNTQSSANSSANAGASSSVQSGTTSNNSAQSTSSSQNSTAVQSGTTQNAASQNTVGTQSTVTGNTTGGTGNTGTSTDTSAQQAAVSLDDFYNAVNALPEAESFKEENLSDLINAQRIYNQLSESQLSELDAAVRIKFITIKNSVQETILISLKAELTELPSAKKLKASDKEKVLELADMYSLLNDDAKIALDEELRTKLEECIEKVAEFEDEETSGEAAYSFSTVEIILIAVLVVLNLLAIAFCVFNCIKSYKLIKSAEKNDESDDIEEDSAE